MTDSAPRTIRDLVRDLSGFDDVDDAIDAVIPVGITLLSPDFVLSRESMTEVSRKLFSNDPDIVSDTEFTAWGLAVGGGDPEGDLLAVHSAVLSLVERAVVSLLVR